MAIWTSSKRWALLLVVPWLILCAAAAAKRARLEVWNDLETRSASPVSQNLQLRVRRLERLGDGVRMTYVAQWHAHSFQKRFWLGGTLYFWDASGDLLTTRKWHLPHPGAAFMRGPPGPRPD